MTGHLSKSEYLKGKQCAKALWLHRHSKNLLPGAHGQSEARFESGREVGEIARMRFPGGSLVDCKPWEIKQSVRLTEEFISQGVSVIYEAAALATDGAYARVDILQRSLTRPDAWNMIEVKSSSGIKDYHIDDVALQYHAFTCAGYNIDRCLLLHINSDYVRHGELDVSALFTQADITDQVKALQPTISPLVTSLLNTVSLAQEPQMDIGAHCSAPVDCDFKAHCWKHVPEYSIFNVLQAKKAFELVAATGSYLVKDIPAEQIPKGAKAIDLRSYLTNDVYVDKKKLQEFVAPMQYPLYYLDFETIGPTIPMYDGTRPYQPVTFQFSLHIEYAPDKLESKDYLHWQRTDPREEFVEQLLKQCGNSGSIIVYNRAFEAGCIEKLAEAFPQHATALLALNERMFDLLVPFRQRWLYHPKQNGSASIKAVLPAFTNKSYEELDIADGSTASEKYLAFMQGRLPENEAEKLYSDLVSYCELDTYAMVELMRIVRSY